MNRTVKHHPTIEVAGINDADVLRRLTALKKIETHLDTDVLEILATKSGSLGINTKVRTLKHLI